MQNQGFLHQVLTFASLSLQRAACIGTGSDHLNLGLAIKLGTLQQGNGMSLQVGLLREFPLHYVVLLRQLVRVLVEKQLDVKVTQWSCKIGLVPCRPLLQGPRGSWCWLGFSRRFVYTVVLHAAYSATSFGLE